MTTTTQDCDNAKPKHVAGTKMKKFKKWQVLNRKLINRMVILVLYL